MTWDMELVTKIRGLSIQRIISDEQLASAQVQSLFVSNTIEKTINDFIDAGHDLAVDIDRTTLRVMTRYEPASLQTVYTVRWQPNTRAAELVGGPYDGQIWAIQQVGDEHIIADADTEPTPEDELNAHKHIYEMTGWNPGKHCWIYTRTPELPIKEDQ